MVENDKVAGGKMRAVRVHQFGPPSVIALEDILQPIPAAGEVLVRVHAAGVGPWDGWIRAGKSVLPQPLPLTLGSDISGVVESVGPNVPGLRPGDEVYGVTNARFTGGYAEYAAVDAGRIARKPRSLSHVEAASMPVVAVTAWQMLFEHAGLRAGQSVLIHGAAGSVGSFAVQLARRRAAHVIANAAPADHAALIALGAERCVNSRAAGFESDVGQVDVVIDTVGGELLRRSLGLVRAGGSLISAVAEPDAEEALRRGIHARFMLVQVNTEHLEELSALVDAGELRPPPVHVLPLSDARVAHEMLEGSRPRGRGKIVLQVR
jgi:NADPH:quinone reductase-like Zn-dependent oxidoreductase